MAKKVITKKARVSIIKKRWYTVQAPKIFNNVVFGETLAAEPESLTGRGIKTNLSSVIRSVKKQNMEVRFKITEVQGNICMTELMSMEILPPHVKRIVKRAKKRVDDSFIVTTKDDVKVRLKPMILVKDNVQHSLLTSLRFIARDYFAKVAQETNFNEFVNIILMGDIYKDLKAELKKVYPVSGIEMRAFVRE
ncbi:MAG: hypothetical protein Q8R18_06230 [bacterium]|nr:hypothetical protein [bacterium]